MSGDPARRAAYDVVLAVDTDAAYANLLLPRLLRERDVTGRDAAFATELGYGTLRYQGALDQVIAAGASRDIATLDAPVRAVLRLGAYQLLHTRVPAHAAVSATVALAKAVAGHRPSGLVNAVLRRVSERPWSEWVERLVPDADPLGRLAFERGYPRWIAVAFLEALHGDVAELEQALAADRPITHLVARPGRISRDALLAEAGLGAIAGPWSEYAVRLPAGGDPGALPAVRDGRAAVQDEGSQLVALVLARALLDGSDGRWFDLCAGPGGKTALLDGLRAPHCRLVANDRLLHRARLVSEALSTPGRVMVADGMQPAWRSGRFDRVLVDAPCTGLGALRRRPDARWRRHPADVDRLQPLQVALLRAAIAAVRPGGLVCYSTCSPHLAETIGVLRAVRDAGEPVEPVDVRPLLPAVPMLGAGPSVQLWPHRHGTDAMFVSLLRRRG